MEDIGEVIAKQVFRVQRICGCVVKVVYIARSSCKCCIDERMEVDVPEPESFSPICSGWRKDN